MVFEGLSEKFQDIFAGMRRKGKLDEADIKAKEVVGMHLFNSFSTSPHC